MTQRNIRVLRSKELISLNRKLNEQKVFVLQEKCHINV